MKDVFLTVLSMSLAGGILTLIVLALRLILRRAPKWVQLVLWGLVGLRLALPFFPESHLSLMPREASVTRDPVSQELVLPAPVQELVPHGSLPAASTAPITPGSPAAPAAPAAPSAPTAPVRAKTDWLGIASYVWAGGAAAMLIYAAVSFIVLRRRLATAVRLSGNVYESEAAKTPFLLGIFRPRIYLPFGLDEGQRALVLSHERAHIKNLDHIYKPIGFLLLAVHWFDPLAWAAYIMFSKDIELACDERVIRSLDEDERADYSQTLLDISRGQRMIAVCPLAFGGAGAKERVKSVFSYKKPAFWIIILAVLAIIVTAVCFLTRPKTEEAPEKQPTFSTNEAIIEYAGDNGWAVTSDPEYMFVCGEEEWDEFIAKVNGKEPAQITIAVILRFPSGEERSGEESGSADSAQIKLLDYDGEKFTVRIRNAASEEFDLEREYAYLDRFGIDGEWTYALTNEPLVELSRTDEALLLSGDAFPLFTVIPKYVLYTPEMAAGYAEENGCAAVIYNEFNVGEDIWNSFVRCVNEGEPASVTVLVNGPSTVLSSSQGDIEADIVTAHAMTYDGEGFTIKSAALTPRGLEGEWTSELRYPCLFRYTVNMDGRLYGQYVLTDEEPDGASTVISAPIKRGGDAASSYALPEERPAVYPLFTYAFLTGDNAADAPRPLTEEEKATVSLAYRAIYDVTPNVLNASDSDICGPFAGLICYGVFGDTAVLFESGAFPALWCREIGGYRFCCSSSFSLFACRGLTLVPLEQAYSNGWITDEQLCIIHELHNGLFVSPMGDYENTEPKAAPASANEPISEAEPVIFDEVGIARAVRQALDIPLGTKITAKDLSRVTTLGLTGAELGSFSELQRFSSLNTLMIRDAPNADFDSIPVYTKLEELSVRNCGLTDISFVSRFTGLEYLDLSDNYIEDVSPLRALPNLKLLNIENNRISSIDELMKLPALSDIEFSWNPLTDAQADALIEHVMSNGDPDFGPSANFYTGDKSRFACWPVDLDEDGVDEYFYANLDWMAIDFVSYVWLEDANGRRLGDWLPCGTGHAAFGTYALVNDENHGACIMRIAPEFNNRYYGYDLYDLRDGRFQQVTGEEFYNYDALVEEKDGESMADFLDPVYVKAYEERMRELLDSGYVLVTTDIWGVMMRELYLKDSGESLDRPSGTMAIICTEGASVDPARRKQYEEMGILFVDEELGYRFRAEPFRGENN